MAHYTCPSCGAELPFRSSVSVYAVCQSCGSTVVRNDRAVQSMGTMAALPEEISPMQVGTRLQWSGRTYTLLGRLRIGWADGAWTEWFIDDGAGGPGWLTEAQGLLAASFERPLPSDLGSALPELGAAVSLDGEMLRVADIKQGTCLGSQGELPFVALKGREATYVDMVGSTAGFAGLEYSAEGSRLYRGGYLPFAAFHFENLRQVEGWPAPAPGSPSHQRLDPRYAPAG